MIYYIRSLGCYTAYSLCILNVSKKYQTIVFFKKINLIFGYSSDMYRGVSDKYLCIIHIWCQYVIDFEVYVLSRFHLIPGLQV